MKDLLDFVTCQTSLGTREYHHLRVLHEASSSRNIEYRTYYTRVSTCYMWRLMRTPGNCENSIQFADVYLSTCSSKFPLCHASPLQVISVSH